MKMNSMPPLWTMAALAAFANSDCATGQKPTAIAAAGKVFQKRCAKCHTVPDPGVATDRSWLDQVNRTS